MSATALTYADIRTNHLVGLRVAAIDIAARLSLCALELSMGSIPAEAAVKEMRAMSKELADLREKQSQEENSFFNT